MLLAAFRCSCGSCSKKDVHGLRRKSQAFLLSVSALRVAFLESAACRLVCCAAVTWAAALSVLIGPLCVRVHRLHLYLSTKEREIVPVTLSRGFCCCSTLLRSDLAPVALLFLRLRELCRVLGGSAAGGLECQQAPLCEREALCMPRVLIAGMALPMHIGAGYVRVSVWLSDVCVLSLYISLSLL